MSSNTTADTEPVRTAMHDLQPAPGSVRPSKRVGRGIGAGQGKTCGRGHKGDKARGQVTPHFEGGQTPLHRRLPERRGVGKRNPHGFHSLRKRREAVVNVRDLDQEFADGAEVTPDILLARGLVRELNDGLKVLGDGAVSKKLTVSAHGFSGAAQRKLEAAGGTVIKLVRERR